MAEGINLWAERSRAIAKEHCSMKRAAVKEYRKAGLFSITNFRNYYHTAMDLDKVFLKAHAEEWERLVKAEHRISLEEQFRNLQSTEIAPESA